MESDGFKPRIGIMCQRWYSNVSYQFIYFFSDVDVSLTEIKKRKVDSGKQLRNNMWCNLGTVVIEDMDESSFVRLVGWLVGFLLSNLHYIYQMESGFRPIIGIMCHKMVPKCQLSINYFFNVDDCGSTTYPVQSLFLIV